MIKYIVLSYEGEHCAPDKIVVPQELESQRPNTPKGHILNLSLDAMRFSMRTFSLSIWTQELTSLLTNVLPWVTYSGHRAKVLPHVEGPEDLCHLKATQLKDS